MKKLVFILLLGCAGASWGQTDTLYEENLRKAADLLFKNLDSRLYGPSLLNRAFSSSQLILEQTKNEYNQIHTLVNFVEMYQDLAYSYVDSTYMMNIPDMANFIDSVFLDIQLNFKDSTDELVLPFGLVYHHLSGIDSTSFNENNLNVENFSYVPLVDETTLYSQFLLKSCGVLDFYPDNGYLDGYLKFTPQLISLSPDISNVNLRIDVGNGFLDFNEENNLIQIKRDSDSLIGICAIKFEHNNITKYDTIIFEVFDFRTTTILNPLHGVFAGKWDHVDIYRIDPVGISFSYGIKYGCGNQGKLRRPIIMIPPYRPFTQPVSMNGYYDQFNFKSMIDILVNMGYDVIFLRLNPGNTRLESAGILLAGFINQINIIKANNYPNESWENIVIGFSMGGQVARYALKKMEHDHMENRLPHHHTRLYIPFDSPHLGANIPMFTQFVYQDLTGLNLFAALSYNSLTDDASRGMGICHVSACPMYESNINYQKINSNTVWSMNGKTFTPAVTAERLSFLNDLNNMYHQFTPFNDLRKTYPTFTRNVAVSVGGNTNNYDVEYTLSRGKHIYSQDNYMLTLFGGVKYRYRQLYASKYAKNAVSFVNRMENLTLLIPIVFRNRIYRLNYGYEWDMAQGGYKDEFWDKNGDILGLNIVPVGAVPLLNTWGIVNTDNNKLYFDHMGFLPMLSSLHINPNLWYISEQFPNGNLKFNLKNEGLMYNVFNFNPLTPSNTFGYPNLGHPSNHFNITPFEAIYCDQYTYEHIKMQASVTENGYDDEFLVHTRNFVINEVESDVVYLQNKTIGLNHVQNVPAFKYRAWYKAYTRIEIGYLVTPKTDPGNYVIEKTGDITVYAGESVVLKPGFHAQNGSTFHAFIKRECARPPANFEPETSLLEPQIIKDEASLAEQKNRQTIYILEPEVDSAELKTIQTGINDFTSIILDGNECPDPPIERSSISFTAIRNED